MSTPFFDSYLTTLIERDVTELSLIERRGELRRLLALLAGRSGGLLSYVDSGIACHLLGQDVTRLGEPGGAAGPMVENFVLMELARQLTWSDERAYLYLYHYHYRTKDKIEVDAVVESADGRVIAIEVKAGSTVRAEDLAGLRHLADRLGSRFIAGYVFYAGQQTLPFGDRLRALPIDALWHVTP